MRARPAVRSAAQVMRSRRSEKWATTSWAKTNYSPARAICLIPKQRRIYLHTLAVPIPIQFNIYFHNSIAKYTTQNNNICIKIHSKVYTNNMNIIKQSRSWYGGIFKRPAAYTEMPFDKDIQEKGGLKTNQRRQTKKTKQEQTNERIVQKQMMRC